MFSLQPDLDASLTGRLLIAMPALVSSPFAQTVVFLCAHSAEDGAMGLVVNRRLGQPGFDDLLEQLGVAPVPPRRRITLCAGGPVENSRGFVLHSADWTGDGSLAVDDGIVLTASLDILKVIADGAGPRQALLALGHATWEPGQLEAEIQQNAWLSAPATEAIVFGSEHDSKWRRALASLRIDPIRLSSATGHA
ncbi:YqgE/AlgH family protein [Lichenicoccus sp.]|uniref:YqgE/AlgH family protein n=1 Tax=Lichenicoccus sp. TaxID=2781899 RepID=UPI003D122E96